MSPATPKYVARIARLPLVFEHLAAHRDGLSMGQLAAEFDVPPEQLREDLLAFYTADVTPDLLMGLSRPGVLGFFGPDGRRRRTPTTPRSCGCSTRAAPTSWGWSTSTPPSWR